MLGIFLDIESTGLDFTRHHVIEIALKVLDLTTGELMGAYDSVVRQSMEAWRQRDPLSIEVNGFTFERVQQGKDPLVVADEITHLLDTLKIQRGKAVFICQNPSFDRGFFTQLIGPYTQEAHKWPYHWLDLASMYLAVVAKDHAERGIPMPEQIKLSKNDIAKSYQLPTEAVPHRAMNGVTHLIQCFEAVLGIKMKGNLLSSE